MVRPQEAKKEPYSLFPDDRMGIDGFGWGPIGDRPTGDSPNGGEVQGKRI